MNSRSIRRTAAALFLLTVALGIGLLAGWIPLPVAWVEAVAGRVAQRLLLDRFSITLESASLRAVSVTRVEGFGWHTSFSAEGIRLQLPWNAFWTRRIDSVECARASLEADVGNLVALSLVENGETLPLPPELASIRMARLSGVSLSWTAINQAPRRVSGELTVEAPAQGREGAALTLKIRSGEEAFELRGHLDAKGSSLRVDTVVGREWLQEALRPPPRIRVPVQVPARRK